MTIDIDPNAQTPEGWIPCLAADLPVDTAVGDIVMVGEVESGWTTSARVASIGERIAYLEVNWSGISTSP